MKKYTVVLMWIFILGSSCIYAQNSSISLESGEKIKIIFEQKTLRQPEAEHYRTNAIPFPLKVYISFPKRWETNYFSDMEVANGEFDYKIISGNAAIMATVDGSNAVKCNGGFKADRMAVSWLDDRNAVNCPQTAHHVFFTSRMLFKDDAISVSTDSVIELGTLYFKLTQEGMGFQVQAGVYPADINEGSLNRIALNLKKELSDQYIDQFTNQQDWGKNLAYFEFIPGGLTLLKAPEIRLNGDSLISACPQGEFSASADISTLGAAVSSPDQIRWQYAEALSPATWLDILPDSDIRILHPDFIAKGESAVSTLKINTIPTFWEGRLLRCVVEDDDQNKGYMEATPIRIHTLDPLYLIIDSSLFVYDARPLVSTETETWKGSTVKVFDLEAFRDFRLRPSALKTPGSDIPYISTDTIYEYITHINTEEIKYTKARLSIISVTERPTYYYARTYRTLQKCLVTTDTLLIKPKINIEAPTFDFSTRCFGGGSTNSYTIAARSNLVGKTPERWEWVIRTDELLNIEDSVYTLKGTNYAAKLRTDDVDDKGMNAVYQLREGAINNSFLTIGATLAGSSLPYKDLFAGALYPTVEIQKKVWANKFLYVRYFTEGKPSPWGKMKISGSKTTPSRSTPDTIAFLVNGVLFSPNQRDTTVNMSEAIIIQRTGPDINIGESIYAPEVFTWEREDPLNSGQWYFEKKNKTTGSIRFNLYSMPSLSARYRVRLSVGACDTVSQPITIYVRPDTLPLYAMEASSLLLSEELVDADPSTYSDVYENDYTQSKATTFSPIKNEAVGNSHILSILPNPMRERAELTYEVLEDGKLSLKLYTLLGECVQTLIEAEHTKGMYHKTIDVEALPNGIYFLRLESYCKGKMQTEISKIILRK